MTINFFRQCSIIFGDLRQVLILNSSMLGAVNCLTHLKKATLWTIIGTFFMEAPSHKVRLLVHPSSQPTI